MGWTRTHVKSSRPVKVDAWRGLVEVTKKKAKARRARFVKTKMSPTRPSPSRGKGVGGGDYPIF